jgi:hypothetical protein
MAPNKRRRDSVVDPNSPKPEQEERIEDEIEQSDDALFEKEERINGTPSSPERRNPR